MTLKFAPILVAGTALGLSAPAAAQPHSAPAAHSQRRDVNQTLLDARLASVNARIASLRSEQLISREEALDLRDQARAITRRLIGKSARDTREIEFELGRLENRVRFATEDARWGRDVFADREEHHVDVQRYQASRDPDYEHFDRYTGSSVDRWHDPFDRGN